MSVVIIDGLSFALPLFIMAIGGIYCEKSGVTMLAVEGLQGFGAFVGAFVAVLVAGSFDGNSPIPFYIAMFFAVAGGGLFALIHALLCLKFKANQVISGVVVNILAMALTAYLTKLFNRIFFGAASDKFVLTVSSRITVPVLSDIPVLGAVFTNIYPFEIVIVAAAFLSWFVMYKTRFGMHLRACGDNPHAVDAAGRSVGKIRLAAIVICGALSGLGGICFAYSISANFSSNIYVGYGYLAIAALIFGNWRILPTLAACLLFGFARSGGYRLVQVLQMPSSFQDLVMTLPYVLTLLLLVFFSKQNGAPKALGAAYDKGAR
nr:ABC transporter permease [uncultured Acetatifactor sp.]